MADTLARNSSSAPRAWSYTPDSSVSPTTDNGGTSEIAMATPGERVADVGADEGHRADRAGGQRGQQVDQSRADPARYLGVGRRGDRLRDGKPDQVAEGDDHARPGDDYRD